MLLITSIFSTTFVALRSGARCFYFKYVWAMTGTDLFGQLDRSTRVSSPPARSRSCSAPPCLGSIAAEIDKKYYAAVRARHRRCFVASFFVPKDAFRAPADAERLAQFCRRPHLGADVGALRRRRRLRRVEVRRRSTGLVYSASLFAIKTGLLVGGFLLPALPRSSSVSCAIATQTRTALLGITLAFSMRPDLFALLKRRDC
jgi:GPH family glycoside/pentoside/hexuronide:cation symporter